jgi:uncharacterized protein (DUF4213/DUF364 family)
MNTITINKWWDSLTHEQKRTLIKEMNTFNWGIPIAVHSITKKHDIFLVVEEQENRNQPEETKEELILTDVNSIFFLRKCQYNHTFIFF